MSGWIKLHRSIQRNWVFDNDQYFKAWVTILMEVNHEKKGFVFSGTPIICERGQSAYSIINWCKMFGKGWSVQKVRTFFKHLVNDGMIIVEEVKRITTKLTVCNYDTYQSQQQTDNKPITNIQQTDNKPLTTTKELKSIELDNETILTFDQFYSMYDKKVDKKKAEAKYKKVSESDRALIKKQLPLYVKSTPDKQFRKSPSVYLNGEHWHDEIVESVVQPQKQSYADKEAQKQADSLFAGTELESLGLDIIKGQGSI